MTETFASHSGPRRSMVQVVLQTALLLGTLDISAAIIKFYLETGRGPAPIFRYIASGAFGPEPFMNQGFVIAGGVFFHYLIALIFTALLFILYPKGILDYNRGADILRGLALCGIFLLAL